MLPWVHLDKHESFYLSVKTEEKPRVCVKRCNCKIFSTIGIKSGSLSQTLTVYTECWAQIFKKLLVGFQRAKDTNCSEYIVCCLWFHKEAAERGNVSHNQQTQSRVQTGEKRVNSEEWRGETVCVLLNQTNPPPHRTTSALTAGGSSEVQPVYAAVQSIPSYFSVAYTHFSDDYSVVSCKLNFLS